MTRTARHGGAETPALRPEGRGLRLRWRGYEGGLSPLQAGGWRWWLRDAASFFEGECDGRTGAEATLMLALERIESGMRPNWEDALDRRPHPPRE